AVWASGGTLRCMKRPLALLLSAAVVLAAAMPAHAAAKKSCGGKILAASGDTSVVSITPKKGKNGDAPKDSVYGCWIPAGKKFALFTTYLEDETNIWTIVGGRYIGDLRTLEGGVQGQGVANTWDARKRVKLYGSDGCSAVGIDPDNDETYYGPEAAVFF